MRFAPTVMLSACAAFALLAPNEALAQPPDADKLTDGPFVYAAPGVGAMPFGSGDADDADDWIDLSYMTQIGGGYFLNRNGFMMAFGAQLDFIPYNLDEPRRVDVDGWQVKALPEIRLGAGDDWFFIYGNIKPGFVLSHIDWRWDDCDDLPGRPFFGCDGNDFDTTAAGFNFGHSGGAMFKIYKGLTAGAEIGFDHSFFFDDDEHFEQIWMADFILFAGWFF